MKAWTDYPIDKLGDSKYAEAPIRECDILACDIHPHGMSICRVEVSGVTVSLKPYFLYSAPGRCTDAPRVAIADLPVKPPAQ